LSFSSRLPDSTSETFARLPMIGTRSRGESSACSMRKRIAAAGLGWPIGTCFSS
jgi:hypothetical protein